jgi:hypothetical protein
VAVDPVGASTNSEFRNEHKTGSQEESPNANFKIQMSKEIQMSECPKSTRGERLRLKVLGFGIDLTFEG